MPKAPCTPPDLNAINLDWRRIMPLLGQANAALGRYDGLLRSLPNAAVLLSPITTNEAVLSSRIEGTQVTLEEVLQQDGGIDAAPERQADMVEVRNYRNALFGAEASMAHRPISLSLIKEVHQALMQGFRGQDKAPGEFRNDQNWIGRAGSTMEDARFIPPNPLILPQALEAWESYIANTEEDPVLQIAIVHAQFEILHPFKDGNGRIGRMLIPLVLYQRGLLSRPMFYLSEYLEANRAEYYDRLLAVTDNDDWQGWVEFFTNGVLMQADQNLSKAQKMHALYNELKDKFIEATKSQFAVPALDAFFKKPILNSTDFAARSGIGNRVTANSILKTLTDLSLIQILKPGAGRTPHIYVLGDLLNIAEGRDVVAVRPVHIT